jgi:acyl-coenzyme A synthetase/AMP-(fatty) acid ligase
MERSTHGREYRFVRRNLSIALQQRLERDRLLAMTVTKAERRRIIRDYEAKRIERMRELGRTTSEKKRRAVLKNLEKANAARKAKRCKPT